MVLLAVLSALAACSSAQQTTGAPRTNDLNQRVLSAIDSMPKRGGYDASQAAVDRLATSVTFDGTRIQQRPKVAGSTFCSGATYLVLLRVIDQLQEEKVTQLHAQTLARFAKLDVTDGEELFGRWNANGPGAAKLVHDLGAGVNFTDYDSARPGDFLKLWWTDAIGGRERGHLVVYLSHTANAVTFWSANQPGGYGTKTVPRSQAKRVLFTRLTNPKAFANGRKLSPRDPFLAAMLRQPFTWNDVVKKCGVRKRP